ncbi:hypothetical protein K438DRAFT_1992400 [Mycena galopus ATCC 62051]|nr:hypothetical protein K438DRAFT_1992400 [Mycena galopus ATCC 62051]
MTPLILYALFCLIFPWVFLTSAIAVDDVAPTSDATTALSFTNSEWIWTPTTTANALVAFRKDFTPPLGKSLIAAEVIITASNTFTFYVNGDVIGSQTPPHRGGFSQRFCIDLLPSLNVFAVNASTTAAASGALIATIFVTYQDGTHDTIPTDSSWRISHGLPLGFEQLSFDDTTWPVATVVGAYGDATWGTLFIPADPPVLALTRAQWRAFRRTFTPAPGQIPATANILIAADNAYALYINGVNVGNGTDWKIAQHYVVNFASAPGELVLAILATNTVASAAGVLLAMEVNMVPSGRANCTAGSFLLTDNGWVSTKGAIPSGWELPGFDDSAWPAVVAEATYPSTTWGTITVAAASAPVTI